MILEVGVAVIAPISRAVLRSWDPPLWRIASSVVGVLIGGMDGPDPRERAF